MEEHMKKTLWENNEKQRDNVNGMMKSFEVGCSFEDRTLAFGFPVLEWEANRAGFLHGGIIAAAFDIAIAALARFYAGKDYAPTVNFNINYIRPIKLGSTIIVESKAVATGKRISHITADMTDRDTGKLLATATAVHLNIDIRK